MCEESKKSSMQPTEAVYLLIANHNGSVVVPPDLVAEARAVFECKAKSVLAKLRPEPVRIIDVAVYAADRYYGDGYRTVRIKYSRGADRKLQLPKEEAEAVASALRVLGTHSSAGA